MKVYDNEKIVNELARLKASNINFCLGIKTVFLEETGKDLERGIINWWSFREAGFLISDRELFVDFASLSGYFLRFARRNPQKQPRIIAVDFSCFLFVRMSRYYIQIARIKIAILKEVEKRFDRACNMGGDTLSIIAAPSLQHVVKERKELQKIIKELSEENSFIVSNIQKNRRLRFMIYSNDWQKWKIREIVEVIDRAKEIADKTKKAAAEIEKEKREIERLFVATWALIVSLGVGTVSVFLTSVNLYLLLNP